MVVGVRQRPMVAPVSSWRTHSCGGDRAVTRIAIRVGVLGGFVLVWWLLAEVMFGANTVVSKMGPVDTISRLAELLTTDSFVQAISVSLYRVLAGLAIAVVIGLPLGALVGSRALVDEALDPIIQLLRMTSPLAWAPLALVLLGAGSGAVIALVALAAVWPIVLGVAAGVRALDPKLARVARSLGATRWETIRSTALPALAVPTTGAIRVALGIAWVVLVPAEMLGVTNGLGYAVLNARDNVDYTALAATMLAIGVLGYLLDRVFRGIHRIVRDRNGRQVQ
ncbi:putative ABC transporter permease protein [Gordonia hirsuta DSM 44140 = NBRC 16056]|uniref:Putative ABC transporter permease protein n=1 Tax=Gordonia hirsuta DSM 44140 = NBRC 16056 TaxID=1121927 RepID=L7LCJ6_9ACTN|nr:putative ABC transporter permease protein [Gordonia hirsuta DSM 44140 = NBRC 16056]